MTEELKHDNARQALSVVCDILSDKRVNELRDENDKLRVELQKVKLDLFWRKYSAERFEFIMREVNENQTYCGCLSCCLSDRCRDGNIHQPANVGIFNCTWKPVFEQLLRDNNFTFAPILSDQQCHFYTVDRDDWVFWEFGSLLPKLLPEDNPEVQRYAEFLDRYHQEEDYDVHRQISSDQR